MAQLPNNIPSPIEKHALILSEINQSPGSWRWITDRFQRASIISEKKTTHLQWEGRILMCLDGIAKEPQSWIQAFTDPGKEHLERWALQLGFKDFNQLAKGQMRNIKSGFKPVLKGKTQEGEKLDQVRGEEAFFVYKLFRAKKWNTEVQDGRDVWESKYAKDFKTALEKWKKILPAEFSLWDTAVLEVPKMWSTFYECPNYYEETCIFTTIEMPLGITAKETSSKSMAEDPLNIQRTLKDEKRLKNLAEKYLKFAESLETKHCLLTTQANEQGNLGRAGLDIIKLCRMIVEAYCNATNKEYCDFTENSADVFEFIRQQLNVKIPSGDDDIFHVRFERKRKTNPEDEEEIDDKSHRLDLDKAAYTSPTRIKRRRAKSNLEVQLTTLEEHAKLKQNEDDDAQLMEGPSKQLKKDKVGLGITVSPTESHSALIGICLSPAVEVIGNTLESLPKFLSGLQTGLNFFSFRKNKRGIKFPTTEGFLQFS